MSGTTDFALVVETLRRHRADGCVIGSMAVNSYVERVYTADLDLVVATSDLKPVLADLQSANWRIKKSPHSINAQIRAGLTERTDSMLLVRFGKPADTQPFVDALPDAVVVKLAA